MATRTESAQSRNIERNLDPNKLIRTSEELAEWIGKEFPHAHLAVVAAGVHQIAQEAVVKASRIRQPILLLRIPIWGLVALAVAGAVHQLATHRLSEILQFLDETKGAALYLFAFLLAFITLEVRWKRRRALKAISDLRAQAHIVDMHQLAKDEAIEQFREEDHRTGKILTYLHACTALLALLSKIGQLYVEHFPDTVATQAANDFEMITTGLSNKIWMKILSMKKFEIQLL
jgi:hypothetical protein